MPSRYGMLGIKYHRIVGNGVDFDFKSLLQVQVGVPTSAMHLWHATQGIGVLHTRTVGMGSDDFGVLQQLVEGICHMEITRIRPELMQLI